MSGFRLMGQPGDVERLREVLELLAVRGLNASHVRVGGIELHLRPSPLAEPESEPGEAQLTSEEQERAAKELYESTMYASSEGQDIPS